MSYLKLMKSATSFDLIPADNIVHVKGTEGAAESGAGDLDGLSPFVEVVYGTVDSTGKLLASKVVVGSNTQDVATTTAALVMEQAVNDAILKAAQAEGLVVTVDFDGLLNVANYIPSYPSETFISSAAPTIETYS
mgnify:CR=1 FL=1|jgi:hypothetical protein|tara:strand:- start:63 stop:467 length:405 start_codon:yes stop_codon:yes gene_type:complete